MNRIRIPILTAAVAVVALSACDPTDTPFEVIADAVASDAAPAPRGIDVDAETVCNGDGTFTNVYTVTPSAPRGEPWSLSGMFGPSVAEAASDTESLTYEQGPSPLGDFTYTAGFAWYAYAHWADGDVSIVVAELPVPSC